MKRIKRFTTLKEWRDWKGISQREAAELLGLTQSLYSKIELGQNAPRPKRGKTISDKTGVSFEAVMGVA